MKELILIKEMLENSPIGMIDIEVLDYGRGSIPYLGFHSKMEVWDNENESWDEYLEKVGFHESDVLRGGIFEEVENQIEKLGYMIQINDCDGLENEGIIVKR